MTSKKFSISKEEALKWMGNAAIFFAPAALVFLLALQSGADLETAAYTLYLWGLNVSIDFLRKYVSQTNQ